MKKGLSIALAIACLALYGCAPQITANTDIFVPELIGHIPETTQAAAVEPEPTAYVQMQDGVIDYPMDMYPPMMVDGNIMYTAMVDTDAARRSVPGQESVRVVAYNLADATHEIIGGVKGNDFRNARRKGREIYFCGTLFENPEYADQQADTIFSFDIYQGGLKTIPGVANEYGGVFAVAGESIFTVYKEEGAQVVKLITGDGQQLMLEKRPLLNWDKREDGSVVVAVDSYDGIYYQMVIELFSNNISAFLDSFSAQGERLARRRLLAPTPCKAQSFPTAMKVMGDYIFIYDCLGNVFHGPGIYEMQDEGVKPVIWSRWDINYGGEIKQKGKTQYLFFCGGLEELYLLDIQEKVAATYTYKAKYCLDTMIENLWADGEKGALIMVRAPQSVPDFGYEYARIDTLVPDGQLDLVNGEYDITREDRNLGSLSQDIAPW